MSKKIQEILEKKRQQEASSQETEEHPFFSSFCQLWTASDLEELHHRYLDLRFRDGTRAAFDYPDRKFITYLPEDESIHINFGGIMVSIQGRGLDPELYDLLLERKVAWIKEADAPEEEPEGTDLFIEEILITHEDYDPSEQETQSENPSQN